MATSPPEQDSHAAGSGSSTGDPGNARAPKRGELPDRKPDPNQPSEDPTTRSPS